MEINIKNIGLISSATIRVDTITVIAGENGTGKSTIGKALYTIFESFHNIVNKISSSRNRNIFNLIDKHIVRPDSFSNYRRLRDELRNAIMAYDGNDNLFSYYSKVLDSYIKYLDTDKNSVLNEIKPKIDISDEDISKILFQRAIEQEFSNQISSFGSDDSSISLKIKNNLLEFNIIKNKLNSFSNSGKINILTDAIYYDDPLVLDRLNGSHIRPFFDNYYYLYNHRENLINMLYSNLDADVVDQVIIKELLDKISNICSGELSLDDGDYAYIDHNSNNKIYFENVSLGLKTFITIKMLLLNGNIQKNGTLILDEPEIHLHPEWQVQFAEIIVLLNRIFGLHILLTTHSPYFVNALEVYIKKYNVVNSKFYLTNLNKSLVSVDDVTQSIDNIYKMLYFPLEKLREIENGL